LTFVWSSGFGIVAHLGCGVVEDELAKSGKWHLNLGWWDVGDIGCGNLHYRSCSHLNVSTQAFSDWGNITNPPHRLHLVLAKLGLACMWSMQQNDKNGRTWGYLNVSCVGYCICKENRCKMDNIWTTRIVIGLLWNLWGRECKVCQEEQYSNLTWTWMSLILSSASGISNLW
jgi:hypothetical protein